MFWCPQNDKLCFLSLPYFLWQLFFILVSKNIFFVRFERRNCYWHLSWHEKILTKEIKLLIIDYLFQVQGNAERRFQKCNSILYLAQPSHICEVVRIFIMQILCHKKWAHLKKCMTILQKSGQTWSNTD